MDRSLFHCDDEVDDVAAFLAVSCIGTGYGFARPNILSEMHTETAVALVRTMGWQRTFSPERKLVYLSQTDVVVREHRLECDTLLYHFEINPVVHMGPPSPTLLLR